jgi:hypothetical protein
LSPWLAGASASATRSSDSSWRRATRKTIKRPGRTSCRRPGAPPPATAHTTTNRRRLLADGRLHKSRRSGWVMQALLDSSSAQVCGAGAATRAAARRASVSAPLPARTDGLPRRQQWRQLFISRASATILRTRRGRFAGRRLKCAAAPPNGPRPNRIKSARQRRRR